MRVVISLLLVLMIMGCIEKRQELNREQALNVFVKELDIDISDYKSILFIPLEGCGSCIEHRVEFYKEYSDDIDILYVFCTYKPYNYDYLKNIDRSNVIVDSKNIAIKHQILSTAPVVYKKVDDRYKCIGTAMGDFDFTVMF